MGYLLGIVVFVVILAFSIAWHELGHLIPAKLFRVKVTQYMIGFGPTLWSRKKGETEYGVKAIPLGGYIRMVGMYPPEGSAKPDKKRWFGGMQEEAHELTRDELADTDEARAFFRLSAPKKLVVMLGGPTQNLILAFILTAIALCGIGAQGASTTLDAVNWCGPAAQDGPACDRGGEKTPAQKAGMRAGDTIVEWDGRQVRSWEQLSSLIAKSSDEPQSVVVKRDGRRVPLTITPIVEGKKGKIGVWAGSKTVRQPLSAVPAMLGQQITASAQLVTRLPVQVYQVGKTLFTGEQRDQTSPLSIVGVARMSGEVTEASTRAPGGTPWQQTVVLWLLLAAALNIALWLFNLIPLPPLDGGHVAGALWEGARRSWARMRGRGDVSQIHADTARGLPLAYGVFAVLITLTVVLILADIVNPVRIL